MLTAVPTIPNPSRGPARLGDPRPREAALARLRDPLAEHAQEAAVAAGEAGELAAAVDEQFEQLADRVDELAEHVAEMHAGLAERWPAQYAARYGDAAGDGEFGRRDEPAGAAGRDGLPGRDGF